MIDKSRQLILALMLFSGFLVRLYRINAPLADWHSWRQADTAAVARNFLKYGYDLLHPRFDDLSNIPSGKDNPQGYRFVEFPIFNLAHARLYQCINTLIQGISFEAVGRMVSIFSSLIAAIFLYLIVKNLLGECLGLLSMSFFLFLPFNIYYSRTILPDPTMVMFSLGSIYFLENYSFSVFSKMEPSRGNFQFFLSLLLAILAILVKPYAIFLLAPSWIVVFSGSFKKTRHKFFYALRPMFYALISVFPFLVWRWWMKQFPEGVPANRWLFNLGAIRFRPAWWRWLFAERLGKLILGLWGLILFGIGLICKTGKQNKEALFYSWLLGIFAYLAVFARGNVQHDYYQILAIPTISVFLAKGAWFLLTAPRKYFNNVFSFSLSVFSLLMMFGFSWYQVRGYYQINHPQIVAAGKAADQILPKTAKIIAPYNGDTAFLYQTKRRGWPAVTTSIPKMVALGAEYYVAVNFDNTTNELVEKCPVLNKTKDWVIINLKDCKLEKQ